MPISPAVLEVLERRVVELQVTYEVLMLETLSATNVLMQLQSFMHVPAVQPQLEQGSEVVPIRLITKIAGKVPAGQHENNNAQQKALEHQAAHDTMHNDTVGKPGTDEHGDVEMLDLLLSLDASLEALLTQVEVLLLEEAPRSAWEPGFRRPTPPSLASGP